MDRNTITTLGELQEGDRFTYLKASNVWQVVGFIGKSVLVNQFDEAGNKQHKFDHLKWKSVQVKFLRNVKEVKA